jgi:glutathione S-transferase
MDLYCAPLACSMATRIAIYEANAPANFIYVDIHSGPDVRRLADGSDYFAINPMGQVPTLRTDDGELIAESTVVLQFVADRYPQSQLAPPDGLQRYRLLQWLNFISTELHKGTYNPLLQRNGNDGAKAYAREKSGLRMRHLNSQLHGRSFLLNDFTIADAYLFAVLNWSPYVGVELAEWPEVKAYFQSLSQRPSIGRALAEEGKLYAEEQKRRTSA